MINDQKKFQEEKRKKEMSDDKRQIRDHDRSEVDKEQIQDEGRWNDDKRQIRDRNAMEDDSELEAAWNKVKEPFRRRYSNLTDSDLNYKEGAFGQMLGRIGSKTGMNQTQLRDRILNWNDSASSGF